MAESVGQADASDALARMKARLPPSIPQVPPPHKRAPSVPDAPKPGGRPSPPSSPRPSVPLVAKPSFTQAKSAPRHTPMSPSPLQFSKPNVVPDYLNPDAPRRLSTDPRLRRGTPSMTEDRDRENEENFDLEKDQWLAYAMKKHPEILEMRERLRPLTRLPSFGRLNSSARTEVADVLNGKQILQLIMEHIQLKGYLKSAQKLEEESKMKFDQFDSQESRLISLLRMGITDVDKVFDESLPPPIDKDGNPVKDEEDEEVEVFTEGFAGAEERDVNIWDEADDGKNTIVQEGRMGDAKPLRAGTLNKLVERLTANVAQADLKYRRVFLLTYQSFTTPEQLLQKLVQRYNVPIPKDKESDEEWKVNNVRPVQLQVCKVLKEWVEKYFGDFVRDNIVSTLNTFVENVIHRDGHQLLGKQIKHSIASREAKQFAVTTPFQPEAERRAGDSICHPLLLVRHQDSQQQSIGSGHSEPPPEPKVPKNIFSRSLQLLDIDEEEVARQLTTIDSEIFCAITAVEFLNQAWRVQKYHHRAPNVRNMVQRHANLKLWVADEILRAEKLKQRIKVWCQFVKICEHLRALRNFHSLSAIIEGMQHESVARLRWTKEGSAKQAGAPFAELERLLSKEGGFRRYHDAMYAINAGVTPCVPFLVIALQDLQVMEDSNPDFLNGLINFAKCSQVYNTLVDMQQFQQKRFNLQPVHQIQTIILNLPAVNEEDLKPISLKREPPGVDKNHCQ